MKFRLVMNPGSRSRRGARLWSVWKSGLRERGIEFDCVTTDGPGHAFRLARDSGDYDVIVAVGGDGTINEVLDGIMQSGNSDLRMGVLYSGTSPDFCRFHGIPVISDQALDVLAAGVTRRVDVAKITYSLKSESRHVGHFGCGSNIGMGAAVAKHSNAMRGFLGDRPGTALAVVRALMLERPVDLELEIDGETHSLVQTNNLSILKNPYIGSGLRVNTALRPDDGRLAVLGVHGRGRMGLLRLMPGFYSGKVTSMPGVLFKTCSHVLIRAVKVVEVEFDGDPHGYLPVEIEVVPKALNLIGGSSE